MYNIRFHGRGGQGMKTASRLLGSAFFLAGYEVQDAPRYGAERRGAPMTSYVRADTHPIYERGIIREPGLVIVADDSLIQIATAGVLSGFTDNTVLLIISSEKAETWRDRLDLKSLILIIPDQSDLLNSISPWVSATCAGAAAALTGVISKSKLQDAVAQEFSALDSKLITSNRAVAVNAFTRMSAYQGLVKPNSPVSPSAYQSPEWLELPLENAGLSSPTIHGGLTSIQVRTGLWRIRRPVINYDHCKHCWWICSSSCPDGVINITKDSIPEIDYEHCKGCMICVAQCPSHAIETIPEAEARQQEHKEEK